MPVKVKLRASLATAELGLIEKVLLVAKPMLEAQVGLEPVTVPVPCRLTIGPLTVRVAVGVVVPIPTFPPLNVAVGPVPALVTARTVPDADALVDSISAALPEFVPEYVARNTRPVMLALDDCARRADPVVKKFP